MASFGENLKRYRMQHNLTQAELADKLGTSKQVISRYENGQRSPKISVASHYAKALGIPLVTLSGGEVAGVVIRGPQPPERRRRPGQVLLPSRSGVESMPVDSFATIPVVGSIKCGPGGLAYQEVEDRRRAPNVKHPREHFYLKVFGDSMEPKISEGDLALVRKQEDVESGELAAVVINDEEGTLKRVIKKDGAVILQAFNPEYPPRVFTGKEINNLKIVGKVVRTEKDW